MARENLPDVYIAKELQDPFRHTGKDKYYDVQLRAVASQPFPYGNIPKVGQTLDEWIEALFAHSAEVHKVRVWRIYSMDDASESTHVVVISTQLRY